MRINNRRHKSPGTGTGTGTRRMDLYVYMHGYGEFHIDNLYQIKLPCLSSFSNSGSGTNPTDTDSITLSPILDIPNPNYPRIMGCAHFDSKLYFFGGHSHGPDSMSPADFRINNFDFDVEHVDDFELTHKVYSPNVYVFDTKDPTSGLNQCPSMHTGKPSPFTFVAHGMIYVLAVTVSWRCVRLFDSSINRFERFDPVQETWQVLDDTPLQQLCFPVHTTVFEKHHKVVVFGLARHRQLFRLVYDFKLDKWDSNSLLLINRPIPYFIGHVSNEFRDGGCYAYGVKSNYPFVPLKLGPLKDPYQLHKLSSAEISVVATPPAWNTDPSQTIDWRREAFYPGRLFNSKFMLHHLGDGYFCHVMTGHICNLVDEPPDCPHTCCITVIIFKELSSRVQGGEEEKLSFDADLVYIQRYVIKMRSHASSDIGGLFVVSPGNSY